LREHLHRKPFVPFVVELREGRWLAIKQPPVVFDHGAASFIDPVDGALVEFTHKEVKAFGLQEKGRRRLRVSQRRSA
jgi:hypothetical protein